MVRRAPDGPFAFSADDRAYILSCLEDVEASFGFDAFPGLGFDQIPGCKLIALFIDLWRGQDPETEAQRTALGRLPAAIRLLDTVSSFMEERTGRKAPPAREEP